MNDTSASTKAQFQAYYLQRATAELAEDLDTLRTADDFAMTTAGKAKATGGGAAARNASKNQESESASSATVAAPASTPVTFDSPLQMLIEALRQGADMFLDEDQKRVVMAGVGEESMRK